jgi:hypothetical protein
MPDGTQEAGGAAPAAAPLLVLGCEGPVPGAWEVLPDPGPRGVLLRAAVVRAEARARELREHGRGPDRAASRQFLGHELRSPLAAIKTAVDVLQGEAGPAAGPRRMLDLAARNVERLAVAVEWTEDLLEFVDRPPVPRLQEIDLDALAGHLGTDSRPVRVLGDAGRRVLTDPALLRRIVEQLQRAVSAVHPRGAVELVLEATSGGETVHLHLTTTAEPRPVPGLQTGGTMPALERLVAILCPSRLLDSLGLEPVPGAMPRGRGGLTLALPAVATVPAR